MTYYKAVGPDGTSFYDRETFWKVGQVTYIDGVRGTALCQPGILHASDAPGEVLQGGRWPCRLFEVEPVLPLVAREGHKVGAHAWRVTAELCAWQAFGPNGQEVIALIDRARHLTRDDLRGCRDWYVNLNVARESAWYTAWCAAGSGARSAAWKVAADTARFAAWAAELLDGQDAVWYAVWYAVTAMVVRDLISPEDFDMLAAPWHDAIGALP